jgi:type II secretory pathway component GspD/PulD (secretin)
MLKRILLVPFIFTLCANCFGAEAKNDESLTSSFFYRCKYAKSSNLKKVMDQLITPFGRVASVDSLNAVIVYDSKENIDIIRDYVEKIDIYVPQIYVDARVVEFTVDSDFESDISHALSGTNPAITLGEKSNITLNTPGANPDTTSGLELFIQPIISDFGSLNQSLKLLVTAGKATILSSPSIIVDYENEGNIITGEQIPVLSSQVVSGVISTSTQFKNIGIKLKISPIQVTETSVKLGVNPEVSTVTGYTTSGGVSNPIIAVRSADTVITVKDGEIISIGGLMKNEERNFEKKVPLLGDIPLLGLLFRSDRAITSKTRLMFFIKINILKEGQVDTQRIFKPFEDKKMNETIKGVEEGLK